MLKLEDYEHDKRLTLTDFIYLFLSKLNFRYRTVYSDGMQQCCEGKQRSLSDITAICQSYYNTTQEEVKEILLNFGDELVGHYCVDIEKRVYVLKRYYPIFIQGRRGDPRNLGHDEYGDEMEYRNENINILNMELIEEIKEKL